MTASYRQYLKGPFGQIHLHIWGQVETAENILICLPPSPYSGRAYDTIAPKLTRNKSCVIAVDYPRHDGDVQATINDYARVIHDVINNFKTDAALYLIGFHTGCLVAVETSLITDVNIAKLILIDVPYFSREKQRDLKALNLGNFPITANLLDLQSAWDMSVTRQQDKVSVSRSFELFVDHISAGLAAGEPFAAAFDYDCETQFSKVSTPNVVIATRAGLHQESLSAAKAIKNSILIEEISIEVSVLEQAADKTADVISRCIRN